MASPKKNKQKTSKKGNATSAAPSVKPASTTQSWWQNQRLVAGILFLFSLLLYANTFGHQYAQDDAIAVYDNMFTTQGVKGIPGIFAHDTFYGFFQEEGKDNLVAGGRYRPFSLAFLAIEYQIFGDKPGVFHFFNALWYGLTVVVLYLFLLQLFRNPKQRQTAFFIALAAAMLFLVHPVHTEAVANIKGRDEILSLLGSLAALYFCIRAFRESKLMFLLAGCVCYFLALLSKENAITMLAMVPLSLYYFTKAKNSQILTSTLAFLGVAVLFIILRTAIIGFSLGESSNELMNNPFLKLENGVWVDYSFGERLASIFASMFEYLRLLLVPHPLSHDYYPRAIDVINWGSWQAIVGLLAHLGIFALAVIGLRKRDPLSYGLWFYLAGISIYSNILFAIGTNLSERFLFMPSVGFCIVLAVLAQRYLAKAKEKNFQMAWIAIGVIGVLFAFKTFIRNPVWQNNYTLFTNDIKVQPNSAKLRNAVGGELLAQTSDLADGPQKTGMLQEALGHLTEAIRLHPTYKNAYLLRGNANYFLQNYEAAIADYQQSLAFDPGYQDAIKNLNIAYRDAGKYYGESQGDTQKAINYLLKAYVAMPEDYTTRRLLGVAFGISGQHDKAIELFQLNADAETESAGAWFDLGSAYFGAGRPDEAEQFFQRARQLDPEIDQKRRQARQ